MVLQGVVSQQLVATKDKKVVPAFEVMLCNTAIRNMIRESKTHQIETAIFSGLSEGMIGMDTSLLQLYDKGVVTQEEILTHSISPEMLLKKMNR
jgi:twitching motility protein PilT